MKERPSWLVTALVLVVAMLLYTLVFVVIWPGESDGAEPDEPAVAMRCPLEDPCLTASEAKRRFDSNRLGKRFPNYGLGRMFKKAAIISHNKWAANHPRQAAVEEVRLGVNSLLRGEECGWFCHFADGLDCAMYKMEKSEWTDWQCVGETAAAYIKPAVDTVVKEANRPWVRNAFYCGGGLMVSAYTLKKRGHDPREIRTAISTSANLCYFGVAFDWLWPG